MCKLYEKWRHLKEKKKNKTNYSCNFFSSLSAQRSLWVEFIWLCLLQTKTRADSPGLCCSFWETSVEFSALIPALLRRRVWSFPGVLSEELLWPQLVHPGWDWAGLGHVAPYQKISEISQGNKPTFWSHLAVSRAKQQLQKILWLLGQKESFFHFFSLPSHPVCLSLSLIWLFW